MRIWIKTTNTNCLTDFGCPRCGSCDGFTVTGTATFTITDEGTQNEGDYDWSDDSDTTCTSCGFAGEAFEFASSNPGGYWVTVPEEVAPLLSEATDLLSDPLGTNPEYERALIEVTARVWPAIDTETAKDLVITALTNNWKA